MTCAPISNRAQFTVKYKRRRYELDLAIDNFFDEILQLQLLIVLFVKFTRKASSLNKN